MPRPTEGEPRSSPARDQPPRTVGNAVEGAPPSRRLRRVEVRVIIPLLIIAAVVTAAVTYFIGGLAAVVVGAVLLLTYYLIGWSPEIGAAVLRKKSHED